SPYAGGGLLGGADALAGGVVSSRWGRERPRSLWASAQPDLDASILFPPLAARVRGHRQGAAHAQGHFRRQTAAPDLVRHPLGTLPRELGVHRLGALVVGEAEQDDVLAPLRRRHEAHDTFHVLARPHVERRAARLEAEVHAEPLGLVRFCPVTWRRG